MTPSELAASIENLILEAGDKYARSIRRVQNQLYDDLILKLKDLELKEGYIVQNAGNRRILREAQAQFDLTIANSNYQSSLDKYLRLIPQINELNAAYFKTIESAFVPNKNFLKSLQSQTIKTVNSLILQDGLKAQVQIPLNQLLEQNISIGGTFKGLLKQVQDFVKGNSELEGRLLKYTGVFVRDTLFQYSRATQEAVTNDLGLEWYLFSGPVIKGGRGSEGSRGWCLEKKGKFFHRKEIEEWANESWAGRNPLTTSSSIFTLVGGYNCVDSLIPVSKIVVPKSDLDRIKGQS
jgi:hypothetical protein